MRTYQTVDGQTIDVDEQCDYRYPRVTGESLSYPIVEKSRLIGAFQMEENRGRTLQIAQESLEMLETYLRPGEEDGRELFILTNMPGILVPANGQNPDSEKLGEIYDGLLNTYELIKQIAVARYGEVETDNFKGLELMNPNSCCTDRLLRFRDIARIPDKYDDGFDFFSFRHHLRRAYFGSLHSLDGTIRDKGASIHNGFHRAIVFYMLSGEDGYITLRYRDDTPIMPLDSTEVPEKIEDFIRREGLLDFAREEIARIDRTEEYSFFESLSPKIWEIPSLLFDYFRIRSFDIQLQDEVSGDRKGAKLETRHRERIKRLSEKQ